MFVKYEDYTAQSGEAAYNSGYSGFEYPPSEIIDTQSVCYNTNYCYQEWPSQSEFQEGTDSQNFHKRVNFCPGLLKCGYNVKLKNILLKVMRLWILSIFISPGR